MHGPLTQRGNILFLILLAVILFAALSYAVTASTKGGEGKAAGGDKLQLAVSQLLQDASLTEQTVNRLRLSGGCKDTEISFESAATNALGWSYANVYAPADKHCNVYDAAGGGMSWKTPPKELLDPAATSGTYYGAYMISNNSMLFNMGASNACPDGLDLVLFLGFITDEACTEINKRTGLNTLTTNSTPLWDGGRFRGTYGTPCGYGWNSGDRYSRTGCSRGDSNLPGKQNSFYQILIAR